MCWPRSNPKLFSIGPSPTAARLNHLHPAHRHYVTVSITGHVYRYPTLSTALDEAAAIGDVRFR